MPREGRPGQTCKEKKEKKELREILTQPATVVCKIKAQSEYVHVAYTFFCTFGPDLYAHSVIINKNLCIGAHYVAHKSALLVGKELYKFFAYLRIC